MSLTDGERSEIINTFASMLDDALRVLRQEMQQTAEQAFYDMLSYRKIEWQNEVTRMVLNNLAMNKVRIEVKLVES